MTVAKGMSNCKAERDFVLQGFREQLEVVEQAQEQQEYCFKSHLYDILIDSSITEEEKRTLMAPWYDQLQELEERNIRIRRSIFIGLYSFLEISLKEIAEKVKGSNKFNEKLGGLKCFKAIYGENIPQSAGEINDYVRELRNYIVHGSLYENRKNAIENLMKVHSEFCIQSSCNHYYFRSYKGLYSIMNMFERELDRAENEIHNNQ